MISVNLSQDEGRERADKPILYSPQRILPESPDSPSPEKRAKRTPEGGGEEWREECIVNEGTRPH